MKRSRQISSYHDSAPDTKQSVWGQDGICDVYKGPFSLVRGRSVDVTFGNGCDIEEASFTLFCGSLTPTIEAGSTDPEISTGLGNMPSRFSVLNYP